MESQSTMKGRSFPVCRVCQYAGSDCRLEGCGCTVHVHCFPPAAIKNAVKFASKAKTDQNKSKEQASPEQSQTFKCPFCDSGEVSGIYLFPLRLDNLEKAVTLKKASSTPATTNDMVGSKRKRDEDPLTEDEVSFSVYSRWRTGSRSMLAENEQHRTGRWTDTEMAYVDHLVTTFDEGKLPVAEGVKLNTLLCDLLLCKSSRLTKKMKNAKLSTRTFKAAQSGPVVVNKEDCQILSALQETFLCGQSTETAQLELRFNITRQWRAYFSNFCLQSGFIHLDAKDWISSIDKLERLATEAEEKIRKTRRKSMSKVLSSQTGNGLIDVTMKSPALVTAQARAVLPDPAAAPDITSSMSTPSDSLCVDLDQPTRHERSFSDDFDVVLRDLACGAENATTCFDSTYNPTQGCAPINAAPPETFLDAVRGTLEAPNSLFHHADVWVPSLSNDGNVENVQLLHAGYVTRRDQTQDALSLLNAFGEYSKSFTFLPGQGLPGRVYNSGKASWHNNLFSLDPTCFTRATAASNYSIETVAGIPINTQGVGRMVVILYSCNDLAEDISLANQLSVDLAKYSPQPKWKLVIDINQSAIKPPVAACDSPPFQSVTNDKFFSQFENNAVVSPVSSSAGSHRSSSPSECSAVEQNSVEQEIISLLAHDDTSGDDKAAQNASDSSMPHSTAIKLLLQRQHERRSSKENERIEVLKSSYKSYSKNNTRSKAELAKLLVRDWVCMTYDSDPFSKDVPDDLNHSNSLVKLVTPFSSMGPLSAPNMKLKRRVSVANHS